MDNRNSATSDKDGDTYTSRRLPTRAKERHLIWFQEKSAVDARKDAMETRDDGGFGLS